MPRPPAATAEPTAEATGTTPLPARDMLRLVEAGEPPPPPPPPPLPPPLLQASPLGAAL